MADELEQAAVAARAEVDWAYIEEELKEIPEAFRASTFYPLKHVVEIFSSGDPQGMTATLREREARVGELVDMVVEGYHTGFAHSITSYSHILQLFQESRLQVESVRVELTDAMRQLGAQSKHLSSQWQRSLSLSASLSLLKDVQAVVEIPGRIESALTQKDWPTAVSLLLEAAQRLAREEMREIGALRKLRGDMGSLCRYIQGQMFEELQDRVYSNALASTSAPSASHAEQGKQPHQHRLAGSASRRPPREGEAGTISRRPLRRPLAAGRLHQGQAGSTAPSQTRQVHDPGPSAAAAHQAQYLVPQPLQASTRQVVQCLAQLDGIDEAKAYLSYNARAQVRHLVLTAMEQCASAAAQSYHAVAGDAGIISGTMGGFSLAVPHHVEVLGQKLVQAGADVCIKVLMSLGDVITEVADAPPTPSTPALDLIKSQIEASSSVGPPSALSPTRAQKPGPPGGSGGQGNKMSQEAKKEYIAMELLHVWVQMQEEWHMLLCALLATQLRALGAHAAHTKAKAAPAILGWLQKFDQISEQISAQVEAALGGEKHPAPARSQSAQTAASAMHGSGNLSVAVSGGSVRGVSGAPGAAVGLGQMGPGSPGAGRTPLGPRLQFSLDVKVRGGLGMDSGASALRAMPPGLLDLEATQAYAKLVTRALGDKSGSAYLAPAVYLPLTSFMDAASSIVHSYAKSILGSEEGRGKGGRGPKDKRMAAITWLKEAVEDFVLESFLPQIWMDLRGRCTSALEHADAFRPPAIGLLSGTYTASSWSETAAAASLQAAAGPAGGRPVVAAARFAERMLTDVAAWSAAMPAFEASFMGVAENILGRMLDAFWMHLMSLASTSRAYQLASRPEVAHSQACEPDALLLGDPASFCVPTRGAAGYPGEVDVPAFAATLRNQDRPVLVQTHTGRSGLNAVAMGSGGSGDAGIMGGATRGFASGGEPAELELLMLVFRECPKKADELVTGSSSSSAGRLVAIAALAESLEFMALAVVRAGSRQAQGAGGGAGPGSRGATRGRRGAAVASARSAYLESPLPGTSITAAMLAKLPDSLVALVYRLRALAGQCLRTLRLEVQLLLCHTLQGLALSPHLLEPGDEAREIHPALSGMSRLLSRLADDLSCYLAPSRVVYVLAGLAPAAARMWPWLLPDIREINVLGAERMVRTLSSLQPALMGLAPLQHVGSNDLEAAMRLSRMRAFDRARAYYQMLGVPSEEVVRNASERPMRYGYGEWLALLQVHVPGRMVSDSTLAALQNVLNRAHGLTTGQKFVGAVGTIVSTVLTNPVEKVADVALDVLKLGAEGLVVMPARQIGKVFRKLEEVAHQVADNLGTGGRTAEHEH